MGMVKKEVLDTPVEKPSLPTMGLPSFTASAPAVGTTEPLTHQTMPSKEVGMTRGGVAHDAATITAAMSAMKTDDEVKALFTSLYEHILKTVLS